MHPVASGQIKRAIPSELADQLPSRIKLIPRGNRVTLVFFLRETGLMKYADIIETTRNGYLLTIEGGRAVFIFRDRGEAISAADIDAYLGDRSNLILPNVIRGDHIHIVGCRILSRSGTIDFQRDFPTKQAQQDAAGNPLPAV